MEQPIFDPPIPFLGEIPGGFSAGKMVRVQGYAPPTGKRFNINFQTGENVKPRDDVGLHLSIRLLEGYIARNTLEGGMWGDEEDAGDLPIQPGQKFEVIVLSDESQYKIAVNGRHFCEFPQRLPASKVTHLAADGDVSLSLISYETDTPQDSRTEAPPPSHATYDSSPSAPENYGPPPQAGYGPPPQGGYGPPPQGGYGPPPQGGYGPPPQGGYGPPPSGDFNPQPGYGHYQPPAPPGHEENKESEFGSFLETAGTLLAGAMRSGVADNLISSLSGGGGANQQQQPGAHPQQPQSQQSQGGLAALLSSFTGTQSYPHPQQQSQQGGDVLSGLGSLISSFASPQQQTRPQPQPQAGGDLLSGLGSLISNFSGGQNQAQAPPQQQQQYQPPPPQPPQAPAQSGGADLIGGLSSLLSSLSTHTAQPQQPAAALNPSQGSVGGLGSMTPILNSLASQIITNPKEEGKN